MLNKLLTKLFGSRNERLLRQYEKDVQRINQLEDGLKALSDAELKAKTQEFKQRAEQGEQDEGQVQQQHSIGRQAIRHGLLRMGMLLLV